jgi:Fe2+ transport system protein FeoA
MAAAPLARPLSSLQAGQHALVIACRVEGADAPILRAMGLTEGAVLRVCRIGEPTIVALLCHRGCHCASSRVGLARALAERVMVTEEPPPAPSDAVEGNP